jgi:protein-tyrosine kinase
MSEIFSWLKRAELDKRKSDSESAANPVELYYANQEKTVTAVKSESFSREDAPAKLEIRSDAKFDLAAADRRIRSVLDPVTLVGEHYRLLRAKLSLLQKERGIKTLLITSSLPFEGKTFTACCLAGVFAQEPGKRVLLIDADLRKPRAGQDLGVNHASRPEGLSNILRGEKSAEDVLLSSSKLDFFLLPGGPVPEDPAELLSSAHLEHTLRDMTEIFDWIVIDSPPVIALADATLIARLCDAVVMVVHTDRTPSKLVKESIERIGRDKICGVILNRGRHVKSSQYYYYHYYRKRRSGRP